MPTDAHDDSTAPTAPARAKLGPTFWRLWVSTASSNLGDGIAKTEQLIPEAMFGRVQGAWRTAVWGVMPVGAVLGGLVAAAFGLAAPFIVAGIGHLVVLALGWRLLGRADAEAALEPGAAAV